MLVLFCFLLYIIVLDFVFNQAFFWIGKWHLFAIKLEILDFSCFIKWQILTKLCLCLLYIDKILAKN